MTGRWELIPNDDLNDLNTGRVRRVESVPEMVMTWEDGVIVTAVANEKDYSTDIRWERWVEDEPQQDGLYSDNVGDTWVRQDGKWAFVRDFDGDFYEFDMEADNYKPFTRWVID